MASDEQRVLRDARWRRRFLSVLAFSSSSLHLAAFVCIILLMSAGTSYTAWGSQGPATLRHAGEQTLIYREFALLQFTTNISGTDPTLYWFLDAFGWEFFAGSLDSAGLVSHAVGQTLHFPASMNNFLDVYNSTVGHWWWSNCTKKDPDSPFLCDSFYNNRTIETFGDAPSLTVSAAPAFAFYMIAMALTVLMLLAEFIARRTRGTDQDTPMDRRHAILTVLERSRLAVYAVVCSAHLIAASCVTGAAVRAAKYLRDTPQLYELTWGISLGSRFLMIVWVGFLATVLGSTARVSRWWLKRRWKEPMEWENALALPDIQHYSGQQLSANDVEGERRRPSEHVPIPTAGPVFKDGSKTHDGEESVN
ncbi:hypothetical protein BGZ63DRAFT_423619 [Mariannaea sp. PMI_226]|nr:hypothetical protein BGZ63DRAFT_423619 [Mariannaea sp. PMI_226]